VNERLQNGLQLIVTKFADRWTVFASELGKIGNVVHGTKEGNTFSVDAVPGDREDDYTRLLARQLTSQVWKQVSLPTLLMSSLDFRGMVQDDAMEKVRRVLDMFEKLISSNSM